jgi:hypothetical protein
MENYFWERNGYAEKKGEDQIINFPISLKDMVLSESYIKECFSEINSFYEANELVIKI